MKTITFFATYLTAIVCLLLCSLSAQAQDYLFKSVRIINPVTAQVSDPVNVLVSDTRIVDIGTQANHPNAEAIEGEDHFLISGFTEMHAHVPPQAITDTQRDRLMFLYTAHGITTIRGMLGHPLHLSMRDKLASNEIDGPRLITSGPSFHGRSVLSPAMATGKVQSQKEKGYDFIKVHPGMGNEVFRAMATAANKHSLPFGGHVTASVGIFDSIALGQSSIDHLDGVMEELARRSKVKDMTDTGFFGSALVDKVDKRHLIPLAQELAKTGIAMVPTESLMHGFVSPESPEKSALAPAMKLMPEETVERWKASRLNIQQSDSYTPEKARQFLSLRMAFIRAFVEAGGTVLLGSDAPQVFNVPGDSIHVEMALMVDAGMTPQQVLTAATFAPAKFFGYADEFGSVEKGKVADLVLLKANPLENIENTRSIAGVMTRGQWLSEVDIDSKLTEIRRK